MAQTTQEWCDEMNEANRRYGTFKDYRGNAMTQTTYFKTLVCMNCGEKTFAAIPKGEMIKEYVKNNECKDCGCKTLGETL